MIPFVSDGERRATSSASHQQSNRANDRQRQDTLAHCPRLQE